MTRKTVKDLDVEVTSLKNELDDLKSKLKELSDIIEKNNRGGMSNHNRIFKCKICSDEFTALSELRKHKKVHMSGPLQCDVCSKTFNEEWKMNAHAKLHKKYCCDDCDKTFEYQNLKDMHVKIVHQNVKLYCHYYNNDKDCPFEEECVFLHEDSEDCRYADTCERENCMFKHGSDGDGDDKEDESEDVDDEQDDENDDEIDEESDDDEDDDEFNVTFLYSTEAEAEDGKSVVIEFRIYAPCKDSYLSSDQEFYKKEMNNMSEIESVERLWINGKPGYKVGDYLEVELRIKTKFALKFKNDKQFRQNLWDKLDIKEICPE